jgi:3-oxoacyl-[acyl-carrier-protein] synthase-1
MSETKRVFISGRGVASASGMNVDDMWTSLQAGKTGIDEIKGNDLSSWAYRLGGELKEYQPSKMLPDKKLLKVVSRQDVMGIFAAVQAVEDSQLVPYRDKLSDAAQFNEDTAVYVASPGNKYCQQYDFLPLVAKSKHNMHRFAEHLFSEVHPMWLLRILPNNVLAYTGITYGFKGENHNIVNHASGGMQAILEAYHAIRTGRASRAVVVAYDVGIEPQALFYYERLGILSARHLKPFDHEHDGTVLAEGAAAIVLESEESVRARNRVPYAEITGGFAETEGGHLFTIDALGKPLASLLTRTLAENQVTPADLSFIVAHGNGNPISDTSEAYAINALLMGHFVPVTAYKWSMGHTLCASGIMDTVLAVEGLKKRLIPGIANLTQKASDCDGLNMIHETRTYTQGTHALVINRGFAGMNVSLLLKACDSVGS